MTTCEDRKSAARRTYAGDGLGVGAVVCQGGAALVCARMSVEAEPTFYNPGYMYMTPSPRKRPRFDVASPEALLTSPDETLARIVVEHLSRVDIVSPAPSPSQNYAKAFKTARERDMQWNLSPSKTAVQKRPVVIAPRPETFVHTHPKSWTNEIIAATEAITAQKAAFRVFLDAFYYECGYRSWYQRPSYIEGTTPQALNTDVKGNKKSSFTEDEQKVYVRYHAVMNALPGIPDMDERDAAFLVGRLSGLDKLNATHHELAVRPMAVYLERLSKTWSPEERKQAVMKAFTWLTGYFSYEEAYSNVSERRVFTDEGIVSDYNPFKIPKYVDLNDQGQARRLMQFVSV